MLQIDKVQTLQGLQVFRDDVDPLTFYVLPEQPRFRLDGQGRPVMMLLKYRTPKKRADGSYGGGYLIFDAEFAVDDAVRGRIIDDLNGQVARTRPGAKVTLGTIQWAKGTAKLNFVADGGGLIESVVNPMSPSLFGRNITPFTLELSQEGATFFEQALQGSGGVVQVAYEMSAWVKLPAVTGTASFSSEKYYDFVQHLTDDSGCGDDTRTEEIRESVRSSEIMSVQVDAGIGADPKLVAEIRGSLMDTLEKTTARKMLEQLGQYDGDRGMIDDYEDIRREYHKIKIDSFSYTISERSASLWPFNPQGTLPNITTMVDASGAPIRWSDYARTIDLDDPFFRTLDVTVRLNADLEHLPIHSVDVHLEFDGAHLVVDDMHFGKADDVGKFSCFLDGKPPEYRYSYRVNYEGEAQAYEVAPQPSRKEELTINVDATGLLLVEVLAGNIDFTKIPSALVTVRYEPSTSPAIEEQFAVDSGHSSFSLQKAIFEARKNPIKYKIDYRTADGKTLKTSWAETTRKIYVNSPFSDVREVHVTAEGDFTSDLDSITMDLDYEDATNGYSQHTTGELNKENSFLDWKFPVIDHAAGTVTYSGTIKHKDGTVQDIPSTVAAGGSIRVGPHVERLLPVTITPDLIDFTKVALVRVALRYGSDPATQQEKDLILRGGTSPTWTIELPDRNSPRTYTMSATYYLKDGTSRQLPETTTDDLDLVMPPLPPA
jgi:hypothetical protein